MLTVIIMRASITFAAGQRTEIGRYELPTEESLPCFGMGITIDVFQIAEIRHDVTKSLKSAVVFNRLGSKIFRVKDTEFLMSKYSGVSAVMYSFNNLLRCECQR